MHWTGKVESVAFTVFGREIAWYGIIITTAMLIGLLGAVRLSKKIKMKSDDILEIFLIAIPFAILFARLGYVIVRPYEFYIIKGFNFEDFINIFAVWDGGLTIMTGAPGGILGGFIWCKWRKVDFLKFCDAVICIVLLSQAIGRWGNFFNQEVYGHIITNENWQFFPAAVYIAREGSFHMATFFYEMILDILGFAGVYLVTRRLNVKGCGVALYAMTYSTIRFIMEFMREDGEIYAVINFNQIICAIIMAVSAAILAYLIIRQKKKGIKVWYGKGIPDKLIKPAKYAIYKEGKTD